MPTCLALTTRNIYSNARWPFFVCGRPLDDQGDCELGHRYRTRGDGMGKNPKCGPCSDGLPCEDHCSTCGSSDPARKNELSGSTLPCMNQWHRGDRTPGENERADDPSDNPEAGSFEDAFGPIRPVFPRKHVPLTSPYELTDRHHDIPDPVIVSERQIGAVLARLAKLEHERSVLRKMLRVVINDG